MLSLSSKHLASWAVCLTASTLVGSSACTATDPANGPGATERIDATTADGNVGFDTTVQDLEPELPGTDAAEQDLDPDLPRTDTAEQDTVSEVQDTVSEVQDADAAVADTDAAEEDTGEAEDETDTAAQDTDTGGSCEDGTGPLACWGDFELPSFSKCCEVPEDCAIVFHQVDCCGSFAALGISASEVSQFDELDPDCRGSYPGCGCPSGPTRADDGNTIFDRREITVDCLDNVCMTAVPPLD